MHQLPLFLHRAQMDFVVPGPRLDHTCDRCRRHWQAEALERDRRGAAGRTSGTPRPRASVRARPRVSRRPIQARGGHRRWRRPPPHRRGRRAPRKSDRRRLRAQPARCRRLSSRTRDPQARRAAPASSRATARRRETAGTRAHARREACTSFREKREQIENKRSSQVSELHLLLIKRNAIYSYAEVAGVGGARLKLGGAAGAAEDCERDGLARLGGVRGKGDGVVGPAGGDLQDCGRAAVRRRRSPPWAQADRCRGRTSAG